MTDRTRRLASALVSAALAATFVACGSPATAPPAAADLPRIDLPKLREGAADRVGISYRIEGRARHVRTPSGELLLFLRQGERPARDEVEGVAYLPAGVPRGFDAEGAIGRTLFVVMEGEVRRHPDFKAHDPRWGFAIELRRVVSVQDLGLAAPGPLETLLDR